MAASGRTIQNNPSKSCKFSRETSEPKLRYSLAIGFAFPTNFAYQPEAYHDNNYESINFRSLFNLKELTQNLYKHLQSYHSLFYKDYD